VEVAITGMVALKKPVGALCISPVILAKVLGEVHLTIGNDESTIDALESLGAKHVYATHDEVVVDSEYNLVTTPCYMLDANIAQIAEGTDNVVDAMIKMMK